MIMMTMITKNDRALRRRRRRRRFPIDIRLNEGLDKPAHYSLSLARSRCCNSRRDVSISSVMHAW